MKSIFKVTSWLLIFATVLLSSACLQSESEEVQVTLNDNLSGKVTFVYKDISSSEDTVAAQKQEMGGFYGDLSKTIQDLKELGLKDPKIELSNKTDLRCDAVMTADFDNVVTILPVIADVDKNDFEATRTGSILSLRFVANGILTDSPTLLSIKVPGEVLENNAQSFDTSTNTLQWRIGENGNRRIYLRIKTNSASN